MPAPILVVSGPSGAGKTTVGGLVADSFHPSVHLRTDDFATFVVNGWVDRWLPESAHQSEVMGGAVAVTAMHFAEGGYTVVWDGHLFPEGLDLLAQSCARRGVPLPYAVLRPDLVTCLARVAHRRPGDFPELRGREQERFAHLSQDEQKHLLGRQYERFAKLGRHENNVIDASSAPEEIAATLMDAFDAGRLVAAR